MLNEKVILTDVDGVLLDWAYAFTQWMERHNFEMLPGGHAEYDVNKRYNLTVAEKDRIVRMFNESAWIRRLPPLRDAIKYVKKLHEDHGYVFHAITSLSDDPYSQHLRTKNLRELFGPTVFEKYVYLDTGADKDEVLEKYRDSGCYWVEDKPQNADVGAMVGMKALLMAHDFNSDYEGPAKRVQNWKEIYEMIV